MEQRNNNRSDKGDFRQFDMEGGQKRKSRFLAVVFGFCPGAGHMYLGKMNRGLTLMALFCGDIALGSVFPPALFLLPLIWFYSFFDCLNLSALPPDRLDSVPDEVGFGVLDQLNLQRLKSRLPSRTGGVLAGWALILVGGYMLYEQVAYRIIDFLEALFEADLWWLSSLVSKIPQMVISVLIILLGIRLIRGSRKPSEEAPVYGARRRTDYAASESAPAEGRPSDAAASVMELIRSRGLDRRPDEMDIMAQQPKEPFDPEETPAPSEPSDSAGDDGEEPPVPDIR